MDFYGTIQWILIEPWSGFVWNYTVDSYGSMELIHMEHRVDSYGTIEWICMEPYSGFIWNHGVDLYLPIRSNFIIFFGILQTLLLPHLAIINVNI